MTGIFPFFTFYAVNAADMTGRSQREVLTGYSGGLPDIAHGKKTPRQPEGLRAVSLNG